MKQLKILLADDQALLRSALRLWLEQQPFIKVVEEVSELSSLLPSLHIALPDILLLDWELPGLGLHSNSLDLMRSLRAWFPRMQIIALSSHPESQKRALEAGVDAFVSKTAPPDSLLNAFYLIRGYTHSDEQNE